MKNFLILLVAAISLAHPKAGFSQEPPQLIRPEILELVKQIERDSVLQGPLLGMMGDTLYPSPQFIRFSVLKRKATLDELVLLTDHASPVIRCHAIEAALDSAAEAFLPGMLAHLSDTAKITVEAFDMIDYRTVGGYLRLEVLPSCLLHVLPNEKSYELIRNLVVREEFRLHRIYIFAALEKYPDPVFQEVKESIKLEPEEKKILETLMRQQN